MNFQPIEQVISENVKMHQSIDINIFVNTALYGNNICCYVCKSIFKKPCR